MKRGLRALRPEPTEAICLDLAKRSADQAEAGCLNEGQAPDKRLLRFLGEEKDVLFARTGIVPVNRCRPIGKLEKLLLERDQILKVDYVIARELDYQLEQFNVPMGA